MGLVSHKTLLYDDLSAEQNLRFYARMYDIGDGNARIETVLRRVGLWGRQRDPVRTYSRGMQQRLAIARAMLHDPPILLLDEPDTGLDQHAAAMLSNLLHEVGTTHRTVLMTTHNLERGLELGNRVAILAGGRIACGDVQDDVGVALCCVADFLGRPILAQYRRSDDFCKRDQAPRRARGRIPDRPFAYP